MDRLARLGALAALVVATSCSSSPKCFECGLNKEWARAEAEEQKRKEQAGEDSERDIRAERPGIEDGGGRPEQRPEPEEPEPDEPPPPIPPPKPSAQGCVSVEAYRAYSKALDLRAQATLDELLKAQSATAMSREGFFLDGRTEPPESVYTAGGKRFAVVGAGDTSIRPPKVSLAKTPDGALHPLEPQASGYAVPITVCGSNPCVYGKGARVHVAPIAIELSAGESIGAPLRPTYDSWWAMANYATQLDCGPPPP